MDGSAPGRSRTCCQVADVALVAQFASRNNASTVGASAWLQGRYRPGMVTGTPARAVRNGPYASGAAHNMRARRGGLGASPWDHIPFRRSRVEIPGTPGEAMYIFRRKRARHLPTLYSTCLISFLHDRFRINGHQSCPLPGTWAPFCMFKNRLMPHGSRSTQT